MQTLRYPALVAGLHVSDEADFAKTPLQTLRNITHEFAKNENYTRLTFVKKCFGQLRFAYSQYSFQLTKAFLKMPLKFQALPFRIGFNVTTLRGRSILVILSFPVV